MCDMARPSTTKDEPPSLVQLGNPLQAANQDEPPSTPTDTNGTSRRLSAETPPTIRMHDRQRDPLWRPTSTSIEHEANDDDDLVTVKLSSASDRNQTYLDSMARQRVDPATLMPVDSNSKFTGTHAYFDADGYRASHPGCTYLDNDPSLVTPHPVPAGIGYTNWVPAPQPATAYTQTDPGQAPHGYHRPYPISNDARVRALEHECALLRSDLTAVIARMQALELNHDLAVRLNDSRLETQLPPEAHPGAEPVCVVLPFADIAASERSSLSRTTTPTGTPYTSASDSDGPHTDSDTSANDPGHATPKHVGAHATCKMLADAYTPTDATASGTLGDLGPIPDLPIGTPVRLNAAGLIVGLQLVRRGDKYPKWRVPHSE